MPALPGLQGPRSYAPSPVWAGSVIKPVRFPVMPRAEAVRLYHQAREFERQTRQPGQQDGAIGRNGLAVLHALIFDCLSYTTGRLDPSYETLARLACIARRSVARGLEALRNAGVLTWVRRCTASVREGRYTLAQQTNAYALRPPAQWRGFRAKTPAPPPEAGTWGEHPCGARDALIEATAAIAQGDAPASIVRQLAADATNPLAAVLARLGQVVAAADAAKAAPATERDRGILRSASLAKNHSSDSIY